MTLNPVMRTDGYYIEYVLNGAVVDEAGPFDDEDELYSAMDRAGANE